MGPSVKHQTILLAESGNQNCNSLELVLERLFVVLYYRLSKQTFLAMNNGLIAAWPAFETILANTRFFSSGMNLVPRVTLTVGVQTTLGTREVNIMEQ